MSDPMPIAAVAAILLGTLTGALLLAYVPGMVARRRGHPSAEAISLCGFLGLLIAPLWLVALVWAYTGPDRSVATTEPAAPGGLTCDGCGRPLDIADARQIGPRLICPSCAAALGGKARAGPPPLPGEGDAWYAKPRSERRIPKKI